MFSSPSKAEGKLVAKSKKEIRISSSGEVINQDQCVKCMKVTDVSKELEVLECSQCKSRYHDTCHTPKLNASLVKKTLNANNGAKWECPDCKKCYVCNMANEENKIIICEMCDIAVHIHCLNPPLQKVPSKSWFCNDCVSCMSCE